MSKTRKSETMRVFPETFKQLVFDTVMEASDQMSEDCRHALLDIVTRYDIDPRWIPMKDGKPCTGDQFYWILTEQLSEPIVAKRVKGGFAYGGLFFKDQVVQKYAPVKAPKEE